jgi:molybdopterin-guanine dinucleotide biosynthesis protein B
MSRGIHERTPMLTFVGKSGTGKTTYLERLIPLLKAQGLTLALVKHDAHGFQMDTPGKDTYRFSAAGADVVAISSAEQMAMICRPQQELTLDQVISRLPPVDLILTEGYKTLPNPKIEIHRAALHRPLLTPREQLLAVVTDEPLSVSCPQLSFDDLEGCVALILDFMKNFNQ